MEGRKLTEQVCNAPATQEARDPRKSLLLRPVPPAKNAALAAIVADLAAIIRPLVGPAFDRRAARYRRHIEVIALNLFAVWRTGPNHCLAYSRKRDSYQPKTELGKAGLRYAITTNTVAALVAAGLVCEQRGKWSATGGKGLLSRLWVEPALSAIFQRLAPDAPAPAAPPAALVVIRDGQRQPVCTKTVRGVVVKAREVATINAVLADLRIDLPMTDAEEAAYLAKHGCLPDRRKVALRRIFSRESLDCGGRLYGHFVQSLPQTLRRRLRFNGEPTVEVDFRSIHPALLYAAEGLPLPSGDLYTLDAPPFIRPDLRRICKTLLLVTINARTERGAIMAARRELMGDGIAVNYQELRALLDGLKIKHRAIAHRFGSDAGIRLQRTDSDIAVAICLRMARQGVPCVPVHDSFIVPAARLADLEQAMLEEAVRVTGLAIQTDRAI